MAEGVDYSWARPGGAALKAAGKTFAVRYLYRDGEGGKGLDADELADLQAHGLAVAVVYEAGGNRVLSGAGAADAQAAQTQLVAVGLPSTLPIYFAVDFNATPAQQELIDAYLRGVVSVLGAGRVGVYGGGGVIQRCQANKTATWFWQTYAWSGGAVQPGIHLYQYRNGQTINGGAVDFCRSLQAEFGQHATSTVSLTATPIAEPKEVPEMSRPVIIANTDKAGIFHVVSVPEGWQTLDTAEHGNAELRGLTKIITAIVHGDVRADLTGEEIDATRGLLSSPLEK